MNVIIVVIIMIKDVFVIVLIWGMKLIVFLL